MLPISLRDANAFVLAHHRHSGQVRGCKFCVAVVDDLDTVHGVAIVGRPVARRLDDGKTAEVTRLCTDGIANGCSFLYSRCARIAKLMGYQKIITYTLATETEPACGLPAGNVRRDCEAAGTGMCRGAPEPTAATPAPNGSITKN